jgi:hypothetical protein
VWHLAIVGTKLQRRQKVIHVPIFDSEREITSLPLYPIRFHKDPLGGPSLEEELVQRGKRFFELVKSPAFREYSGRGRYSSQPVKHYENDFGACPLTCGAVLSSTRCSRLAQRTGCYIAQHSLCGW